jgi:hypothetical protein
MGYQRATLDATAYGYIGSFMQPRYEGAIVGWGDRIFAIAINE